MAGWWGFPWGPIYTISDIARNAFGGYQPPDSKEKLLWTNTLAFLGQGQYRLAYALARELKSTSITDIADGASEILKILGANGIKDVPPLVDKWRTSPLQFVLHSLALLALPALLAFAIASAPPSTGTTPASESDWATTSAPPDAGAGDTETSPSDSVVNPTGTTAPKPQPACATLPMNGDVLERNVSWSEKLNSLQIKNGSSADAIIKIRSLETGALLVSFFVQKNETASYDFLPDGNYRVQYAFGDQLDQSCLKFVRLLGAGQFPDDNQMTTDYSTPGYVSHSILSYTLYTVPGGNVRPDALNASDFDAP